LIILKEFDMQIMASETIVMCLFKKNSNAKKDT